MQQTNYTKLLFRILEIIGYQNNRENFVNEFEMLNRFDAVASIVDAYPLDLQARVKACKNETELRQYITEREYTSAYIRTSQNAIQEFIDSIANTLSINQKQKIINLFSSY